MRKVAEFLDKDVGGVPFIIIGETTFGGFAESYGDGIKKAIEELYNKKVFGAGNGEDSYGQRRQSPQTSRNARKFARRRELRQNHW